MKSIIKKLNSALADQIAAGEVVERPASIVKELVENAIDAGATDIQIVVEKGGHTLVQVSDNGRGMVEADLALAFERHATSKIATAEDLKAIATLGFRGEALPSIASVAQVHGRSSVGDVGSEIEISGGKTDGTKPAPPGKGTVITVRNLFFNTPARKKFLKRPATENQHIIEVVRKFALCYPEISFALTSGGQEVFRLPPADLDERIGAVFSRPYRDNLKPVNLHKAPYSVYGYVGNLTLVRGRPKEQYIFLNHRTVHDRLLNSAVYSAFRSLVSRGEYPFFVLNIELPMDEVDVNVHPAKSEVRFRDEWRVFHVVKLAVAEAIRDIPGMIPDFTPAGQAGMAQYPQAGAAAPPGGAPLFEAAPRSAADVEPSPNQIDVDDAARRAGLSGNVDAGPGARPDAAFNPESIWHVHNKYILSQVTSGLVMIDQHVAHERVLFEEALRAMSSKPIPSQTVLFPQVMEFAPDEYLLLIELLPDLEKLGFRIREFGTNTVIVDGTPTDVIWGREREIIKDILDRRQEHRDGSRFLEVMAASYACKAAIKAGDPLTQEEMRNLVDRLFATENPYFCPHGRPTVIHLPLSEIDTRFERT